MLNIFKFPKRKKTITKAREAKKRKAYDGQFKREAVELWKINRNCAYTAKEMNTKKGQGKARS